MLGGLIVDPGRMAKNLGMTHGLIVAEAVMMGLAPHTGRNEAHDLVYDACRAAIEGGRPLSTCCSKRRRSPSRSAPEKLRALTDPANYLGAAPGDGRPRARRRAVRSLAENRSIWARASGLAFCERGGFLDDPPDALGRKAKLHQRDAAVERLAVTRDQPARETELADPLEHHRPALAFRQTRAKLKRNRA